MTTTGARDGAGIRRYVSAGFHSLRHTAVSLLRQAGAAQSVSQAIVGHNSPEVHALYTHTDEDAMRRAVGFLPAVMGGDIPAPTPALPPAMIAAAPGRALVDELNGKNWRTVKKNLLATLTTTVVESC